MNPIDRNTRRNYWRRLALDAGLSGLGSLAAILLMRWVSEPIPGFAAYAARWALCGVALTALAGVLSSLRQDATAAPHRYSSARSFQLLFWMLVIKEAGMVLLAISGLAGLPSTLLAIVALLGDALFSAAALFVPRIFVRSIRREDGRIRAATSRPNILVAGTGRESVALARDFEYAGTYNVLGFLSNNPADAGMVIGEHTVFCAQTESELESLQWRLGGIDAIRFPGGYLHRRA